MRIIYLCICWIIKCFNVTDARYKHEDLGQANALKIFPNICNYSLTNWSTVGFVK